MAIVLGIESTAHTFGVGIASHTGNILSNVNHTYVPKSGGIKPTEAAEHHSKVASEILAEALKRASLRMRDVDAVAVALGPGMGPCLRVGATLARYLALKYGKPLVPVNHSVAHLEIARLTTGLSDPVFVYVAGGNTIITTFNEGRYRVFGETLDIPLGNCLDTFAREVGLGFPGVPKVEELASKGKRYIALPYTVKGQDVSYSGILTQALQLYRSGKHSLEDICYSLVETAYSMLVEVAERALAHTGKSQLVLTGGVARSKILVEKLRRMIEDRGGVFSFVPAEYAGDNGAMIAYTGALAFVHGVTIPVEKSHIQPYWRMDEVEIPWRQK
jgi:N6-L-threonylcarbamoyladenine synthase